MIGKILGQYPIGYILPSPDLSVVSFSFDGFNLSNCGEISLDTTNHDDITNVNLETYNAPRSDGGGVLGWFINEKQIDLKLVIKEDNEFELNEAIDLLKRKLAKPEGTLRISVNGILRSCKASLTSLRFNRDFSIKNILSDVSISFKVMGGFTDDVADVVSENGVSSPLVPFDIENGGGRCEYKLSIVFANAVGTNYIKVTMGGFYLEIEQEINTGDILIVDGTKGVVLYNDNSIDYNGPIMLLEEGSNPVIVEINGIYTADISFIFNKNRW